MSAQIKHIIFDIGNVMVRWSPAEISRLTFGNSVGDEMLAHLTHSPIWKALNLGQLTESEAKLAFQNQQNFSMQELDALFYYIKHTQILLFGSLELLKQAKAAGYQVYALSDNIHEIVTYLKQHYDFWDLFDGEIISADVGYLKPSPQIYQCLLETYNLNADECVFLDDVEANIEGAKAQGMHGIVFENAWQSRQALKALGVNFE